MIGPTTSSHGTRAGLFSSSQAGAVRGGAFAVVFSLLLVPAGAAAAFGGPGVAPRPALGAAARLGAPQTPTAPAAIAGRVSWWKGEDNAVDSVGPNWGTNENGTTFVDGRVGRAFAFDGVDDRVMVPDDPSLALTSGVTIAAWLRMDACTHAFGWCAIVAKSIDGWAFNFNYGLIVSSAGRMSFIAGDGLAYILDYRGPDLRVGDWRHVAVTYDEATLSYFVDGTQVYSVAASVPLTANGAGLYLGGADDAGTVAAFDGDLDEVMLFDRALSPVEVADLAATTSVLSQGLSPSTEPGARSDALALSGDGRYVAFASTAPNLVAGDVSIDGPDIFVYDRQTGTTELVSIDSAENQPGGGCGHPAISGDGRYVAIYAWAWLVADDTNNAPDIFVRDRTAGTTERVSVDSSGNEADDASDSVAITADGRYVAFWSHATNLVAGDTNGFWDVFRHDRETGATIRVSVDSSGGQMDTEDTWSWSPPAISADGRYVAFRAEATNLVDGDTNGAADIFVRDIVAGTTVRVSVDSSGNEADGASEAPAISADGRFVAFTSWASDLVTGDNNGLPDVFVRDRQEGTTERVSLGNSDEEGLAGSFRPSISGDGRYVTFDSDSWNWIAPDIGWVDVFVRDRQTGTVTRVSERTGGGQGVGHATSPALSADGRYVAFLSNAPDLVAGDKNGSLLDYGELNFRSATGSRDVFVHDRDTATTTRALGPAAPPPPGALLLGDGSSVPGGPRAVSLDGRFVAFESLASNLVPGDTNDVGDVFVHDVVTGTIERVSVDSAGNQGAGRSANPAISADGRYVVFDSESPNLVAGDSNGARDVFVRDRTAGTTTRVSLDGSGGEGGEPSWRPAISADGRWVAFTSWCAFVAGDANGVPDVYLRDRLAATTEQVSVDSLGAGGNDWSEAPAISADGRFVAFHSWATDLVANDTNDTTDVFVHDHQSGATTRVSVDSAGVEADAGPWFFLPPAISADGRYVAFDTTATNLVPGDTNGVSDVFLHDRTTGTTTRISVDGAGGQADLWSFAPSITADGRWIAFESRATNLVPGDWWDTNDVFLHDTVTGATILASLDTGGSQGLWFQDSYAPALSPNGACVAFASEVPFTALDVNGLSDLFMRCTVWPTLDVFSDDFESTNVAAWSASSGYVP